MKIPRSEWHGFPDVVIHAPISSVKQHPDYDAGKSGDPEAAERLVLDTVDPMTVKSLLRLTGDREVILTAVTAVEYAGVNEIPCALAGYLAIALDMPVDQDIVQINRVEHTGASGYSRLATPPVFAGSVVAGSAYYLVDDFVGQGGTLANLMGYIEQQGGNVIGASALTGKPYSAKLQLTEDTLERLRNKHGNTLEEWWIERYGYGLDRLTESEARYLERSDDIDTIRNRIVEAEKTD